MKILAESEIKNDNMVVVHRLVDFTKTEAFRKALGVSYTAIYAKAIANTVVNNPGANRRLIPYPLIHKIFPVVQQFTTADVTVAAERVMEGLDSVAFIDVVRDADSNDVESIHHTIRSLQTSTEANNRQWRDFNRVAKLPYFLAKFLVTTVPVLFPSQWVKFRGGAALISSPGKYGMDTITCSWTAPLGFSYGYVTERPMVVEGEIQPRLSCHLIMSFDRRLLAGRAAGLVFSEIIRLMENPEELDTVSQEAGA